MYITISRYLDIVNPYRWKKFIFFALGEGSHIKVSLPDLRGDTTLLLLLFKLQFIEPKIPVRNIHFHFHYVPVFIANKLNRTGAVGDK